MASIRKRFVTNPKTKKRTVSWQVDYRDLKKKRRHRQFATRREADAWLVTARSEIAEGTHVPAGESPTFKEAADAWIKDCKRNGLEKTTIDVYEQRMRDYSVPLIGDRKIGELTVADANTLYEDVLEKSLSRETVRRVRIEVGAVLRYAQRKGWVVKNVISLAPYKHGKRNKKRPPMPRLEEVRSMIDTTTENWTDWLAMLFVLVFCGLRGSELRALCWSDVDLKNNRMSVTRRADRWGNIGSPKSDAGTRDIVFPKIVAKALKEWKLRCPKSDYGLVFPTSTGTVQNHSNIMNRWLRLVQIEAGVCNRKVIVDKDGTKTVKLVAKYGMHALRHFCASVWIEADFSPKRIQTMMGHASIDLTFDTYGYLFEARMDVEKATQRTQSIVLAS
ncbi:site-specific integrase [Bradyrhizobium sp. G127]|uniref:tyrosine-type recombinase/integrase n=1 Tax=Bradyrhizobium sp. G127 TaxID=2904800 RepID=UPI001F3D9D57|nr:site-specific integrase [Bradyrhizobium sp. G127]